MALINRQFRLAARPVGLVKRSDFDFTEAPARAPGDNEVLVKALQLSLDPAMRGWMNEGKSYIPPVQIGEVMRAGGVGKVLESKHPKFSAGDYVYGTLGVQDYATVDGKTLTKIDPSVAPLQVYLSALGMPGMTAYFGLLDIGKPEPGQTVVVSGAAGAVGTVVGQIAKIKGCRAVGIAGGKEKCDFLTQTLGFDAAIDYKSADVKAALRQHCPKGVDVYFDNVGGDILDIVLTQLARKARIVICGAISQYNSTTRRQRPSELPVAAGQSRQHDGHGGVRLRGSLRRRRPRNGWLDQERSVEDARRHRRRIGNIPGDIVEVVQGRELRQAGVEGRG